MTIISGYFLGIHYPKGKNDNVFHNSCLTHIIKYYGSERARDGNSPIPQNFVWTNSFPTQYKRRQIFLNIASTVKNHENKASIVHKIAQTYWFEGNWNTTRKIVKERILNNELKNYRCANAWDCYIRLSKDLSKNGEEENMKRLKKYEEDGNVRVLKNTTLTTKRTFIVFDTDKKTEYDGLISNTNYKHIVYTDREKIPDMNPLVDTQKISQISGD